MNISQKIKWVLQQKFNKMVLVAVEIVLVQVPNLVLMMQVMTHNVIDSPKQGLEVTLPSVVSTNHHLFLFHYSILNSSLK